MALIALIGRPNVGKSALFNRLAGEPKAIVSETAGTTRDRLFVDLLIGQQHCTLVDTGGLTLAGPADELEKNLVEQTNLAIAAADIILLVVDAQTGTTSDDLNIARRLHKIHKPVLVLINKCDNEQQALESYTFADLGIEELYPVSASHGRGLTQVKKKLAELLPPAEEELPTATDTPPTGWRVALIGKPNVGKSSIINALLQENRLLVSPVAGTTRDATEHQLTFNNQVYTFIDTAGLKRPGSLRDPLDKYAYLRSLRAVERADIVLLTVDGSVGIEKMDQSSAQYALEAGKSLIIVINKWDLVRTHETNPAEYREFIYQTMPYLKWAPIVCVSAKQGSYLSEIFPMLEIVQAERHKRLTTGDLNRFLRQVIYKHAPTGRGATPPKIYYATQVSANPPHFVFFVNRATSFHFSYRRYLMNELRAQYGFLGTPLIIDYKNRSEKEL